MKKRFFYLFPLFILLLFVVCSCKDDNNDPILPEPSPEITIPSSENLNPVLSQEGGTVSISFTTTADWTASLINTRAESWITVTPSSGSKGKNEITITATTNETYDERNATVVLKCGSDSKNIVVTQKQKDALTVTSSKYEVASKGGNISVEVKANINFEVEARADWIKQQTEKTRALTTSNLNFTIEPNETGDKREGEIIIKSGELSETIKVYQGFEDFITLTKKDFTIPEEGGNVDIEIKSTLDYEVKMLSDIDWITEIQSRAVSTHTHHYTVSPNDTYDSREAKIVFYNPKDENVADTVSIYQMYKGAILVARNEYQFGIDGGTLNLMVQTNLEFDIEVSDTWIQQIQPTRALTEYNLSFAISKNTNPKDREGTITIKDKNSDKKQVVTIKQSRIDLEREALIALYKATNGDNWTNNTNWCSDKPVSEWYGITALTNPTRILAIDLATNNLSGTLPDEIGNLSNLNSLYLPFNNLIGEIPSSICKLTSLKSLDLCHNNLIGKIPENIGNLSQLETLFLSNNNLKGFLPQSIGNTSLKALNVQQNDLEGTLPESIINLENLMVLQVSGNKLVGYIPKMVLSHPNWKIWYPEHQILNQQPGYGLFISAKDLYVSTDYSMDGEVSILQKHTKGNGIKIVIMGDQFVDTDMVSGGLYETKAKETMEHYFSIEPFKSLRELFDVILIKTVSKNNQMSGETAFSTKFEFNQWGSVSYSDIDTQKCEKYLLRTLNINSLDNIQVIMLQNFYTESSFAILNFEDGFSIANCPLGVYDNDNPFIFLIHHEANGHGFGFLLDEYLTGADLEITEEDKKSIDKDHEKGFSCNIDYISDSDEILWSKFIKDSRYDSERIGIYEGAGSSSKGIYRATETSVMNIGFLRQFNAPSREAIYKRAMKLAYGDSWTYDYEEFVKFDTQGRADWIEAMNKANTRSVKADSRFKQYKHIPPKILNYPAVAK